MEVVVIGSGFSGTVVAREAADYGAKVRVIEKRSHIAGNMYDEIDEHGILVQHYGPHMIITDDYSVVSYLEKFSDSYQFFVKILSEIDGRYVRLPYSFITLQQLMGAENSSVLMGKLRKEFVRNERVSILDICNSADSDVSAYGNLLFEKAFRPYIAKMWGKDANTIDRSVLDRVMMSVGYDERFIDRDFQYMFDGGFTKLFERMLDHPNISVEINTDAIENISLVEGQALYDGKPVDAMVFTGAVDEIGRAHV